MLGERVTMTIILGVASLIVVWILAIPLGVYSAVRQYSLGDQIITTSSFLGLGMPGFLLALLILYFAITKLHIEATGLFSQQYRRCPLELGRFVDLLKHLVDSSAHQRHHWRWRSHSYHAWKPAGYTGTTVCRGGPRPWPVEQHCDLETCRPHRHQSSHRHPGVRGYSRHHWQAVVSFRSC